MVRNSVVLLDKKLTYHSPKPEPSARTRLPAVSRRAHQLLCNIVKSPRLLESCQQPLISCMI